MYNERLAIEQHKFISAGGTVLYEDEPVVDITDITYVIETGIGKIFFGVFWGSIGKTLFRFFAHPLVGRYPKNSNYSSEKRYLIDQRREKRAEEAVKAVYPEIAALIESTEKYLWQEANAIGQKNDRITI